MLKVEQDTINTLRMLSCDAIQKANSGHPGITLGAAPIIYTLFSKQLNHNPLNPDFFNRDRFVLSAGHGSALLYSTLFLFKYGLTIDDIKNFRQYESRTPGHPEYGHTPGVETTTGPLGQGFANAVGLAMAESFLAANFNTEKHKIVDHYTYVIVGDGCMQEGIQYEAASLAGTLKLGKLIALYDCNSITIEGSIDLTFSEDVEKRYRAQGWHVIAVECANDINGIEKAIKKAKKVVDKPSLIIVKSKIGFGSPLEGSADSHGAPLGSDNIQKTREKLNYNLPPFEVSSEVKQFMDGVVKKLKRGESKWKKLVKEYKAENHEKYRQFLQWQNLKSENLEDNEDLWKFDKPDATRGHSYVLLNKFKKLYPNFIGGSADLAPSNKVGLKGYGDFLADNKSGSNIHFGIREHAMSAICNGIALHKGVRPYCATFFVFSDYMKNAVRLTALMNLPVLYIFTHDSIGVGEDGPTHQPIEQLASLRSIPNLRVFRPADGGETAAGYISYFSSNAPTCLVLTRQTVPVLKNSSKDALKGGYILSDCSNPQAIIMASGSEVSLALAAAELLKEKNIRIKVVSMPCMEIFDRQPQSYKDKVLNKNVLARVAVEAGVSMCWHKYTGLDGDTVCIDTFGASGKAEKLLEVYGFTAQNIAQKTIETIERVKLTSY